MSNNPLDEIQARADAATEGPWESYRRYDPRTRRTLFGVCQEKSGDIDPDIVEGPDLSIPDAEFIAHTREDVPRLVAALRAVEVVHQPSQVQRVSHTSNGTIISYRNTDDGPCIACYPEPRELHCEDCEDVDEVCEGVRGSIGTWPCPTIRAIQQALDA